MSTASTTAKRPARRASPEPADKPSGHRARIVEALARAIEEKGYRQTTVADVVRIARTSRRSFYEHFADRDECFLALFDAVHGAMMEMIASSIERELSWEQQIDRSLATYLDAIASRPGLSMSFAYELAALGDAGAARERAAREQFAELLVALVESGRRERNEPTTRPLTMDTATMIVGGLHEMTIVAIQRGRDVHELHAVAAKAIEAILNAALLAGVT